MWNPLKLFRGSQQSGAESSGDKDGNDGHSSSSPAAGNTNAKSKGKGKAKAKGKHAPAKYWTYETVSESSESDVPVLEGRRARAPAGTYAPPPTLELPRKIRPKSSKAPSKTTARRRRAASSDSPDAFEFESDSPSPKKRGRGRPRQSAPAAPKPARRGPGRPRKSAPAALSVVVDNDADISDTDAINLTEAAPAATTPRRGRSRLQQSDLDAQEPHEPAADSDARAVLPPAPTAGFDDAPAQAPNATPRGRGRPRIHPPKPPRDPNTPARPRGRPRKHPLPDHDSAADGADPVAPAEAPTPKRGPGRPRKHPRLSSGSEADGEAPVAPAKAPTPKRGPGPLRKHPRPASDPESDGEAPAAPAEVPTPKRGPGRPRKHPRPASDPEKEKKRQNAFLSFLDPVSSSVGSSPARQKNVSKPTPETAPKPGPSTPSRQKKKPDARPAAKRWYYESVDSSSSESEPAVELPSGTRRTRRSLGGRK